MEFLSQLCLYQSLLLSACRQEEETVVAARLFPLYALDDEARVQIQSILHDVSCLGIVCAQKNKIYK